MKYNFDKQIAKDIGVEEAIMYSNIEWWVKKNKANKSKKHLHDGKYWTFNSMSAFAELFPFWSKGQIRRILKNLISKGLILTGSFNKIGYDKTKWYCTNQQIDVSESTNGCVEIDKPIPDIVNTDRVNTPISESSPTKQKEFPIHMLFVNTLKKYQSIASLDGTPLNNKRSANLLISRIKEQLKLDKKETSIENIKKVFVLLLRKLDKDNFYKSRATSITFLYNNFNKILKL